MFHHVYCNLVVLAKSADLNKSVLEMNTHYCELLSFLSEGEGQPETALNKSFEVFVSERRLYGTNRALNHCLRPLYAVVEEKLFEDGIGDSVLLELLSTGAASMKKKLLAYAKSQLPAGKYWDPELKRQKSYENRSTLGKKSFEKGSPLLLKVNRDLCQISSKNSQHIYILYSLLNPHPLVVQNTHQRLQ